MEKLPISAVIITKDDRERVVKLVKKLLEFLDEVVVLVDNRSEPVLLEDLQSIVGCEAHLHEFSGFGAAKRRVVSMAKNDWIFSLDADEVPDKSCVDSILNLDLTTPEIYKFKRLNHYRNRAIKACGWYPDHVIRLFHRSLADFSDDVVHESLRPNSSHHVVKLLDGDILHYSYFGLHELLKKSLTYSTMYAHHYLGKPKNAFHIILRAKFCFFKCYFLRKGILYGKDGFVISLMNAFTVFVKHWRAAEFIREKNNS